MILLIFQVKHYQIVKEIFLIYLLIIDQSLFESDLFESYPIPKIQEMQDLLFVILPIFRQEEYYLLDKETLHDPKVSLDGGFKRS